MTDLFTKLADAPRTELTLEEEFATIASARAGDNDAVLTLLTNYLPLLKKAVGDHLRTTRTYAPRAATATLLDDLRSAAIMGFYLALDEYAPENRARLGGTLRTTLARALYEDTGDLAMVVRVPSTMRDRYKQIKRAAEERGVNPLSIVSEFGMSPAYFDAVAGAYAVGDEEDMLRAPYESADMDRVETLATARRAVSVLDEKERQIIGMVYGVGEQPALSEREAAVALGMPRSTLQRVHKRALAKMLSHIS